MRITLSKHLFPILFVVMLSFSIFNTYLILSMQNGYKANDSIFNYIVFQEGGSYKAKNQTSSLIDYSSASATDTINQATATGKYVYLKPGTYLLTSNVLILNQKNARIVSDGAIIIGNGYSIIIKGDNYTTSQYNVVSGLTIINGTIRVENSFATTIQDMIFENSATAIELINTYQWTEGTKIDNIHFTNCIESIVFRTPSAGNATGSYASTQITRCFFNQIDNSVGIIVEQGAEFSDSSFSDSRMWLAENGKSNQTGLLVDGSMFQTLLSSVVFESFADTPERVYAITLGPHTNPAPILDNGVSFLGNWTARIYNPNNIWISGAASVFKRTEDIPVATNNVFGQVVYIHDRPLTIASLKPKIMVNGLAESELVTVRVRLEYVDNSISQSVERLFMNTTSIWLTDDEILRLLPSQNMIWALLIDAKSNQESTAASVSIEVYGITT